MSFNLNSTLLCVSSATETIHIFRLGAHPGPPLAQESSQAGWFSGRARSLSPSSDSPPDTAISGGTGPDSLSKRGNGTFGSMIRRSSQTIGKTFAGAVGGYLPNAVTEMWEPARDFAFLKIPRNSGNASNSGHVRSVVAMSSSSPQVMVVTSDGWFYVFSIDMEKGGEGMILKQYS
jgi:autophagy-related protein 18